MELSKLKPLVGSPHWNLVEEYLQERRQSFITRRGSSENDKQSAVLRGRLREIDNLLGLASKLYPNRVFKN